MKKVVDSRQVAHLWAHQSQSEARNSNGSVFFDGDTIFSYGRHFPMARHVNGVVLQTTKRYSVTTSKHQSYVAQACSHLTCFYVLNVMAQNKERHLENLFDYQARYETAMLQAGRARSGRNIEWKTKRAADLLTEANSYAAHFKLRRRLKACDVSDLVERAKKRSAKQAAAERKRIKERAAQHALEIPKYLENAECWRKREPLKHVNTLSYDNPARRELGALLRINGDEIETSQGARFPVASVAFAWGFVKACKQHGRTWQRNGEQVPLGHFQLDSVDEKGNVKAGCHFVTYAECELLAKTLGL